MTNPINSFLLSVVIIHSSPMILNHGPVVISFDLQKCRRTNSCEALYNSNNENPTQLAVANIAFNAKSNKTGKIKLNTTESKASNKEIYKNQTIAINTRENQSENRFNLGIGASDNNHNVSNNSETVQDILFNDTREFSNENVNNFTKENNNLTYIESIERRNWYMKFNGGKDRLIDDKNETIKSISSKWSLQANNDRAENRKSSLNIENQTNCHSKAYSDVIDSNKDAINKLKTKKLRKIKNKIKTGDKKNGINKLEMLLNYSKSSTYGQNNISNRQWKPTVNKYVVDAAENKTIVSLSKKCNDKTNTHNISSQIGTINGTNINVTYTKTSNQSNNHQVIKFNNRKFAGNVKNNQTLKGININGDKNKDSKSNYSMKQSTESKIAYNNKTTWNHTRDLNNTRNATNDARDRFSKENRFFNIRNDDGDFENQTDALEFNIDVNESTTEFNAYQYYKKLYNKMDEIRKSAIDSFIEIDKVPRSKQTQKFEALLWRMVSLHFQK